MEEKGKRNLGWMAQLLLSSDNVDDDDDQTGGASTTFRFNSFLLPPSANQDAHPPELWRRWRRASERDRRLNHKKTRRRWHFFFFFFYYSLHGGDVLWVVGRDDESLFNDLVGATTGVVDSSSSPGRLADLEAVIWFSWCPTNLSNFLFIWMCFYELHEVDRWQQQQQQRAEQ